MRERAEEDPKELDHFLSGSASTAPPGDRNEGWRGAEGRGTPVCGEVGVPCLLRLTYPILFPRT